MKTVIHRAHTRGHVNHGWLDSHHTFSFAGYYDPERVHFGVLRVLNDDVVAGGKGFGKHPHDNMEIVSIPLHGALEHKDSMGTTSIIRKNDVQAMSAGTGLYHSEYNHHIDEEVRFLQIWIFPKLRNIAPRYDQMTFDPSERRNKIQRVVSPIEDGSPSVRIVQDAYFSLLDLDNGRSATYEMVKPTNGLYLFVLEGEVNAGGELLHRRDGMAVNDAAALDIVATAQAELLLMEIPMN